MRCVTVNRAPRTIHIPPTTTYAMPRNGFFPPITVRVDMTMDFVPPYSVTGKSTCDKQILENKARLHTHLNVHLIHSTRHGLVVVS